MTQLKRLELQLTAVFYKRQGIETKPQPRLNVCKSMFPENLQQFRTSTLPVGSMEVSSSSLVASNNGFCDGPMLIGRPERFGTQS